MINPIYKIIQNDHNLPIEEVERIAFKTRAKECENMKTLFENIKADFSCEVPDFTYDFHSKIIFSYWDGYRKSVKRNGKNPENTAALYAENEWDVYAANEEIPWEIRKAAGEWYGALPESEKTLKNRMMIYYFAERMCVQEFCSYVDLLFFIKELP